MAADTPWLGGKYSVKRRHQRVPLPNSTWGKYHAKAKGNIASSPGCNVTSNATAPQGIVLLGALGRLLSLPL